MENSNLGEKVCGALESLNMKATAESFKKEFLSGEDKNEAINVLKLIYQHINKMSESRSEFSPGFNTDVSSPSSIGNKNKKLSTKMATNINSQLDPGEANKIMEGLIEKLTKKYNFENDIQMLNNNSSNDNLLKSKVFNKLLTDFDFENKDDKMLSNEKNMMTENMFSNKEALEDELPHFGGSSKKVTINAEINVNNIYNNNTNNNNKYLLMNLKNNTENSLDEIVIAHENQGMGTQKNLPNNPNNTLKNESCLDDDSIFGDGETNPNNKLNAKFEASNQLDNIIKSNISNNLFALINTNQENPDQSSFFQNSQSVILLHEDSNIQNSRIDEYVDDDDPGFDLYECEPEYFKETCKKLSEQYDFPRRAFGKSKFKNYDNSSKVIRAGIEGEFANNKDLKSVKAMNMDLINSKKNVNENKLYEVENTSNANNASNNNNANNNNNINAPVRKSLLPPEVKFMESGNSYYPLQYNNVIYDCFNLKVIVDRERTGFEDSKEFKIIVNSLIAGRFQVIQYLGSAAFSKAIKCLDIVENRLVCLKIIENNKDYMDQSIDEIKLLRYINANGSSEDNHFLRLYDYFYHKEHLFIVTELLKDNLYDFYKYINENHLSYFTLKNLQTIARQVLTCLEFIHSLKLIHCDLKPENILIKSISDVSVKVIDFGSSCFIHDQLSSYVQSRSYRAPEVILGCKYDYKIDIWSFGCILAELYTGNVLFQNDSLQSLLARIMGIVGPMPEWMLEKGKLINDYFTKERLIYMEVNESMNNTGENVFTNLSKSQHSNKQKAKKMHILIPKRTLLRKRVKTSDENFFDFIKSVVEIDPNLRLNATEALKHPWLTESKYD